MRIALVGTDMAPVHHEAGALERLLAGWATGLAAEHEVFVLSVPPRSARESVGPGTGDAEILRFGRPEELRALVDKIRPDAVVLNNRPGWQELVAAPTVHLFHNWPDAWDLTDGTSPATLIGAAASAAVSRSLAATVAANLGRDPSTVGIVPPFVDGQLFDIASRPEARLVLSPNRLMLKKGVAELVAASARPELHGWQVQITDYLSPWIAPTDEHRRLRALIAGAGTCTLIPPPADRAGMAALYARADVAVCPSIRPEGLGLSAVEAQAVGVPVVSSGRGGLSEATLLPELIVDPSDPAALAEAIVAASRIDPAGRAQLRALARGRFSLAASLAAVTAAITAARPAA
jgi:glycosyltransferase involved in cell wall biosynthesis